MAVVIQNSNNAVGFINTFSPTNVTTQNGYCNVYITTGTPVAGLGVADPESVAITTLAKGTYQCSLVIDVGCTTVPVAYVAAITSLSAAAIGNDGSSIVGAVVAQAAYNQPSLQVSPLLALSTTPGTVTTASSRFQLVLPLPSNVIYYKSLQLQGVTGTTTAAYSFLATPV
jgi:hypothetical protein